MKTLQRGSAGVDPLPEAHIPVPVFNDVKILLQTGRPGDGPIVEGRSLDSTEDLMASSVEWRES